jgi:hypothetical protein
MIKEQPHLFALPGGFPSFEELDERANHKN